MNSKKLRGVCVGAGYFSHYHYEAWRRISDVEIVAFSERDPIKAAEVSSIFELGKCYGDYRQMLDAEQPDFVDIITPPAAHAEICATAAGRGIHIICQKPLAPTMAEAKAIVAEAAAQRVRFMVHENFRFQPWYRTIKQLIQDGAIGNRLHSLSFRSRLGDGWGDAAYLPRQPYFRDYPRMLVYENGVHFIDTYRFLAGEISRVTAWHRRLNPIIKGEDCALLVFEFANGALGCWDANRYNGTTAVNPRYTFGEMLVEGDAGSLRLHLDARITRQSLGGVECEVPYEHADINFCGDCCFFTQRHFVERFRDGRPFETDGAEYLKTLLVQEAVYQSAETRQPVSIPATL